MFWMTELQWPLGCNQTRDFGLMHAVLGLIVNGKMKRSLIKTVNHLQCTQHNWDCKQHFVTFLFWSYVSNTLHANDSMLVLMCYYNLSVIWAFSVSAKRFRCVCACCSTITRQIPYSRPSVFVISLAELWQNHKTLLSFLFQRHLLC